MDTASALNVGNEKKTACKNNFILYDQIKLCIMTDYFPKTISKCPKGEMEFFVRDGELAINYHRTKVGLRNSSAPMIGNGMNRSRLLTFLDLIEDKITEQPIIDYGTIIIAYELLDDGDVDGWIDIKTQINHRRR